MTQLIIYIKKNRAYYIINTCSHFRCAHVPTYTYEGLLTFHCSNNAEYPHGNKLYKIRNLVDLLVGKFKMWNMPSENMCIDESVIHDYHFDNLLNMKDIGTE